MNHTPEPWSYEHGNGHHSGSIVITSFTMSAKSPLAVISDICGDAEQDARRIVACVNACAGLSTYDIEKTGLISAVGYQLLNADKERDTYRDLCAELLSALKPYMEKSNWCYDTFNGYINTNSDLITKAESILGERQ